MTIAPEPWATGVPGLDTLLSGGLSDNALVAVVGPTGAGKTVLASQISCRATADPGARLDLVRGRP
jgi:KaiC/GvpD/RAD55 family RecA-like ATPase